MSLSNYINATVEIAHELTESLSKQDVNIVWYSIKAHGKDEWIAWLNAHEKDAIQYLRATPSQRARKKAWNQEAIRPFLIVAAILHAQRAVGLMEFAEALHRQIGESHRTVAGEAAESAASFLADCSSLWIWEGKAPWDD